MVRFNSDHAGLPVKTEANENKKKPKALGRRLMKLEYDGSKHLFLLATEKREIKGKLAETLAGNEWTVYKPGVYSTYSFQAAVRFRRYASQAAEKLLSRAFVTQYAIPPKPLPDLLDPHQVDGVRWILSRSRSYLAHAPGAGKTLQAIVAALWSPGEGQALFIVPPSLTVNWEREIVKFLGVITPDAWPNVAIVPDTASQESMGWGADFVIVPDSMLTKPWVYSRLVAMKKRLVAVDEASRFKQATAVRTIALFGGKARAGKSGPSVKYPGLVQSARHAVLLDGSPMPNRPMELWAPTYAMSPESIDFMSEQQFGFRYCHPRMNDRGNWEFKGSSNENELRQRLQKNFMHVVREDQLEHPERLRSLVFTSDGRSPDTRAWERRWISDVRLHGPDAVLEQGDVARMRREIGLQKVPGAVRYIQERLDAGEAVLVFAWHRDVVTQLAHGLNTVDVIMGGTPAAEREFSLAEFQAGKTKLLVMNIAAGGRGHNIQRADRIVFVEPSWTDEQNKQCEKRASRRGRAKHLPVKADYLVVPNSLDEAVMSAIFTKERTVKRVIG